MAMVKISNGYVTQIVSRGAFETQYKKLGFHIQKEQSTRSFRLNFVIQLLISDSSMHQAFYE